MKFLIFILMLTSLNWAHGQQSILAAGADASGSGGSLSFSIGQIDYVSTTSSTASISQGVQQPFEFFITGVLESTTPAVQVFPNPTSGVLSISIPAGAGVKTYAVLDISGHLLDSGKCNSSLQTLDMSAYSAGIYFLQLSSANTILKTIKILKN